MRISDWSSDVGSSDLLVDALGIVDLGADRDREELAGRVLVGVRQRQEGQEDLGMLLEIRQILQELVRAEAVADDRAVAEHHALRPAGGAGGIDDAGRVATLSLLFRSILGQRPSLVQELVPAEEDRKSVV